MKDFYNLLPADLIKIKWNDNPVKMDLFLSFLTVPVTKSTEHLGSSNGWTLYQNKDLKLHISGGIVAKNEYLDSIQFGNKLSNPYNNYVNPFFLFDILSLSGKKYFIQYYKEEINKLILKQKEKIELVSRKLKNEKFVYKSFTDFYSKLKRTVEEVEG